MPAKYLPYLNNTKFLFPLNQYSINKQRLNNPAFGSAKLNPFFISFKCPFVVYLSTIVYSRILLIVEFINKNPILKKTPNNSINLD